MTIDHVERAVTYLRAHGYPAASREAVEAIVDRFPWLARQSNGGQHLCRQYVERPDWR